MSPSLVGLDPDRADRGAAREAREVMTFWNWAEDMWREDYASAKIDYDEAVRDLAVELALPIEWQDALHVADLREETADFLEVYGEPGDPNNAFGAYMIDFDLDPCERDRGQHRAECEVTYRLDDGDLCDDTIAVKTTRRNKLQTRSLGPLVCDSHGDEL